MTRFAVGKRDEGASFDRESAQGHEGVASWR